MTIELLYTSAAQGLKQGSRGFCTVLCTAGLPINLAQRLEALSGYRHLYQPGDTRADENPVCHSHIRLVVGGKTLSIVSRVAAYGVDYSQRTNKIAHHVVFDGPVPSCGPAAVLSQTTIMRANWDGECKTLANGPVIPPLNLQPEPCQHWQSMTGDAGWAGVVANAWLQPNGKPVWIIFNESQSKSLLLMMEEATALLPESRRWQATFSTYCTNLPPDVECRVRCVVAGSDEARMSIARGVVLDLTKPLGVAPNSEAAEAARNGYTIGAKTNSIPSMASSPEKDQDPEEEFESAFANRKDKDDYGLQPQLPNVAPVPLKSPKSRGTLKEKRDASEPQAGSLTNKTVLIATAAVALFLSLLSGVAIWFASDHNVVAIVGREPAPNKKEPIEPTSQDQTRIAPGRDAATSGTSNIQPAPTPPAPAEEPPKISMAQSVFSIVENEAVAPDFEVASLSFGDANSGDFKISVNSNHFDVEGGKIRLRPKEGGYNHEEMQKIKDEVTVSRNGSTFVFKQDISVNVEDADDTNLEIVILDENQQKNPEVIYVGAKLVAMVAEGSTDEDEVNRINRRFIWKGRSRNGNWIEFPENEAISIEDEFGEYFCELRYDTKFPTTDKVTSVKSYNFAVLPRGIARINFSTIFFEKALAFNIEVPFPDLPIEKGIDYQFIWAGNKNYLDKNCLKISIPIEQIGNGTQAGRNLVKGMGSVTTGRAEKATSWLSTAVSHSNQLKECDAKLKQSMVLIGADSKHPALVSAFKRFVLKVKPEPSNAFFRSIEEMDAWIQELLELSKLDEEISVLEKTPNSNQQLVKDIKAKKQNGLKLLEARYANVFGIAKSERLPSNEVESEFDDFAMKWKKDLEDASPPMNGQVSNGQLPNQYAISSRFASLVNSVRSLRKTIDSYGEFELDLESIAPITISRVRTAAKADANLQKAKESQIPVLNRVFRVRTSVMFDEIEPKGLGRDQASSRNEQPRPQNSNLQPSPATTE